MNTTKLTHKQLAALRVVVRFGNGNGMHPATLKSLVRRGYLVGPQLRPTTAAIDLVKDAPMIDITETARTVAVFHFGDNVQRAREDYRAPVFSTSSGDAVQPPLAGGGYVTLAALEQAGYPVMDVRLVEKRRLMGVPTLREPRPMAWEG